ncbi:carbohydrate-binding module family 18 protein [Parathielavia appendiculata]|uniref:Carbohydrate-binding module family 18 protein n=1 Tax=Parathielavia appendiculata TaxID=2587402 RepID=A0AAN6U9I5_9PEZI|nr:carbohydrate-binding module family 18 protein [Parathielavia appendiculata]
MGTRSWLFLSTLLLLTLTTRSIAGVINIKRHVEDLPRQPETTCRSAISILDYSAKIRREYELPVCSTGEAPNGESLVGEDSLSLLFGRQVVGGDDYSCGPDRPCKNKACCPKETLQCNYGEEYCGTSGISPNEVCWSNCDAKAECGKNAKVPGQKCPLNVCCGK